MPYAAHYADTDFLDLLQLGKPCQLDLLACIRIVPRVYRPVLLQHQAPDKRAQLNLLRPGNLGNPQRRCPSSWVFQYQI